MVSFLQRLCGSLSVVLVVPLIVVTPVRADWTPSPEPAHWIKIRRQLIDDGQMPRADWMFLEGTRNDRLEAAEYLNSLRRVAGNVQFQGLLLLRRHPAKDWTARPIEMRAVCSDGILQRKVSDGTWETYPGRPGTVAKVNWFCTKP